MAKKINQQITFEQTSFFNELENKDLQLLLKAKAALSGSYSPYSKFKVGAAIQLKNGKVVIGSNQENIAYPSGLCAERVALFHAGSNFPNEEIEAIAVTCDAEYEVNEPIAPCGACLQVLAEYQMMQKTKIKIILNGNSERTLVCDGVENLLPFQFVVNELKM